MKFENFKNEENTEELEKNKEESNGEKQEELENLQEMNANLKDIEGMAVEIVDLDEKEVAEKVKKNEKLKQALDKLKVVVAALGVTGSLLAAGTMSSSDIQTAIIGVGGVIATAIATVAMENKVEQM